MLTTYTMRGGIVDAGNIAVVLKVVPIQEKEETDN
jgi:hypothetical protein